MGVFVGIGIFGSVCSPKFLLEAPSSKFFLSFSLKEGG